MLTKEKKNEIIKEYQLKDQDTGSPEVQVALLSFRINELTKHLKENKKDHSSRRSMYKLIGRRRGLLNYLQNKDLERYRDLIKRLNIRR
ncbi:MAG: 30S ribosomal protein S15 [Tissierellia bacterium]|nr:30S ribosomal protein S15 [Tissierellia bacterium]